MVRNEEKYQLATYYRKQGFSYAEIANIVGVSKGTLSSWFAKKAFSKRVTRDNTAKAARDNSKRIGLVNRVKAAERTARYREAVHSAETEFRHYKNSPLFIAGLMLYKGAGNKPDERTIRLSTADMSSHRIFMKFAREFLGAEKQHIRFWLLLPTGVRETEVRALWTKNLRLSPQQWYKNQVIEGQKRTSPLHYGVGNTIIGSTVLKKKLVRWEELASKELQK